MWCGLLLNFRVRLQKPLIVVDHQQEKRQRQRRSQHTVQTDKVEIIGMYIRGYIKGKLILKKINKITKTGQTTL